MSKITRVSIILLLVIALAGSAYAITTPTAANGTVSNIGNLSISDTGTALSAAAAGGNVSTISLVSNSTTRKWQGFVGTVQGNVSLGRLFSVLYDFGSANFDTVFATSNSSYGWASLEVATPAQVDTTWSFSTAADSDQAADTFTTTATFEGIAGTYYTRTTSNNFASMIFDQGANDVKGDYAFGGNITRPAVAGFDGTNYNFQMLVPVGASPETYYFYLSLA